MRHMLLAAMVTGVAMTSCADVRVPPDSAAAPIGSSRPDQRSSVEVSPVRHPPEELNDAVSVIALSTDGRLVACGGCGAPIGGEIRLFDVASGRLIRRVEGF